MCVKNNFWTIEETTLNAQNVDITVNPIQRGFIIITIDINIIN